MKFVEYCITLCGNVCFRMPLSHSEVQRRYRERKKALFGKQYYEKERRRQQRYYKYVLELSESERLQRNKKSNMRVKKHRLKKKLEREKGVAPATQEIESTSGYSSQESQQYQVRMRFPNRRNGPRKRLNKALNKANEKLRKVIQKNIETNRKLKTLQRKIQRKSGKKNKGPLTPNSKTNRMLRAFKVSDKNVRKELLFANVVLHEMKEKTRNCARIKKKEKYAPVAGYIVKKYRCIGRLAKELLIDRNKVSDVIKNGVNFAKLRRRRAAAKLKSSVVAFLEREDNCRLQPGKKDATKTEEGRVQTRILTDYLANLHQKYIAENPDHKLSLATFCRLRPKHILLSSCLGRNVCLCTKHQNLALKLQALRKCGLDIQQNPETFIKSECLIDMDKLPEKVQFSKWKRVVLENQKKKMKIVVVNLDRQSFYDELMKEIDTFKIHYHVMITQYQQTRILKENLPKHEIVLHMDFAENYNCKTADEIQSAYWNNTQITLHPMVLYYRGSDEKIQHKSYVAVSECLSHSSSTVLAILQKLFLEKIELPECNEINYIHYWTDSPTSQYRNRFIFDAIVNHETLFGCPATWNFYESGHGKNVCDGLGGTVKRVADEYVRSGKCTIQDVDDFMKWAEGESMPNVTFFHVSTEACEHIASRLQMVTFQPVKGTLQLHAVKVNSNDLFCVRNTSCYCEECLIGKSCDSWRVVKGQEKNKSTESPQVEEQHKPETAYATGDYVAAVYDQKWYPGKIVDIDEDESGLDYHVSFMEHKKSLFQWPQKDDTIWCSRQDILCKIDVPVACGKSKRMYKLKSDDLEIIQKFFNA